MVPKHAGPATNGDESSASLEGRGSADNSAVASANDGSDNSGSSSAVSSAGGRFSFEKETVTPDDISGLEEQGGVQALSLTDCEVSDETLQAIGGMAGVETLSIVNCTGFTSLDGLHTMPDLKSLTLNSLSVPSCGAAFAQVEHLYLLSLSGLDILDIVRQFPNLTEFTCSYAECQITDFSAIGDLHALTKLDCAP